MSNLIFNITVLFWTDWRFLLEECNEMIDKKKLGNYVKRTNNFQFNAAKKSL